MITTKDGKGIKDKNWTLKTLTPLGYQKPVEFYSPKYDADGSYDEVPDGMDPPQHGVLESVGAYRR